MHGTTTPRAGIKTLLDSDTRGRDMANGNNPFIGMYGQGDAAQASDTMGGLSTLKKLNDRFPGAQSLIGHGIVNVIDGKAASGNDPSAIASIGMETVEIDNQTLLIPTVYDGKKLSTADAIKRAEASIKSGFVFPRFASRSQAESVRGMLQRDFKQTKEFLLGMAPTIDKARQVQANSQRGDAFKAKLSLPERVSTNESKRFRAMAQRQAKEIARSGKKNK